MTYWIDHPDPFRLAWEYLLPKRRMAGRLDMLGVFSVSKDRRSPRR